ncbi:F0F1 ATP synthase subunit A [Dyadobacter chenhuakuii]|uniref:ATP synthase subunit a n=1 Tax=Dyadobacter chenhuakuii TaxID=2909339 RepID=A0ABY4XSQ6_9BACT|nr:F0F1 ATP synthase subunit A [Dyadobacter chenhuakuii]MCF2492219.1 F0F1 ATP synthase subunit A [Dyadobacter chenhuakuii]USJ33473.1 F0F1 ATP synthase subunit A [Dyadobacter chenhuakuii]
MYTHLRLFFTTALVAATCLLNVPARADEPTQHEAEKLVEGINEQEHKIEHNLEESEEKFNIGQMIMHHIADSHEWEITHGVVLPLPVILYSADRGIEVFSSSNFHNEHHEYNGYHLVHGDAETIVPVDESRVVYDFSITKNVASMMLSAVILILIFTSIAGYYKNSKGKAPKGFQSAMEVIILFIRDDVVKPNVGPKYEKYLPYLLTLFFFILVNNILGLLPGSANVTGNIAVTMTLAVLTFIVVHLNANGNYYKHLVKPDGVPIPLLLIMIPVEIVGVFMKPFSLMVRLFANMTAGHIILLSLFGLIFIFQSIVIAPVISLFALFLNFIEIMVAFIQAFIFTLLSSMYIGSAIEEHSHADHGH